MTRAQILPTNLEEMSTATLSRFFSTRVLRELAGASSGKLFKSLWKAAGLDENVSSSSSLSSFYEGALEELIRSQRSEYVYKNAIAQKLLLGKHSVRTTSLFFEFRAGSSKLDALFLNDSSHAYEIKTSQDELRRLPNQIAEYQQRFEHVWVLTSDKHLERVIDTTPMEIGVAVLSRRYSISVVRKASKRTKFLRPDAMLSSLRRDEYLSVLKDCGKQDISGPNTMIHEYARKAFETIQPKRIHDSMVRQLKARFAVRQARAAIELPRSLTAAGIGLNISELQLARLLVKLESRIQDNL